MFVVTVVFEVAADHVEAFASVMLAQARNSLEREDGCLRFDVCRDPDKPGTTFLYEIYSDRPAFQVHLDSAHFKDFDRKIADWVVSKTVQTYRLENGGG